MRRDVGAVIDLNKTFITNVVMCRPPMNQISDEYIDACSPNVLSVIKTLKPDYVITVGRTALEFMMGEKVSGKVIKKYGHKFVVNIAGKKITVLPVVHPAYILRRHDDDLWKSNMEFLKRNLST